MAILLVIRWHSCASLPMPCGEILRTGDQVLPAGGSSTSVSSAIDRTDVHELSARWNQSLEIATAANGRQMPRVRSAGIQTPTAMRELGRSRFRRQRQVIRNAAPRMDNVSVSCMK